MTMNAQSAKEAVETRWVLLAEDDDDIRTLIRDSLIAEVESSGNGVLLKVVEAKDGTEALEQAVVQRFHCVITDLRMPRTTGDEFIRSMQSHPLNANTPTLISFRSR
jgi:CheY-like chemotaxis protein